MHYSGWNVTISIGIFRVNLVSEIAFWKKASQYCLALYHNWNRALPTALRLPKESFSDTPETVWLKLPGALAV